MDSPVLDLDVVPGTGGQVYYLPLAPRSRDHGERLKIAVRLTITHIDPDPDHDQLTITAITFSYPGSGIGGRTMREEQKYIRPEGGVLARGETATWSNGTIEVAEDEFKSNHVYLDAPAPPRLRIDIFCEGFDRSFSKTFDLIPWVNPTGGDPVRLPFLLNDLAANEYVMASADHFYNGGANGTQIFAHDFGIEALVGGKWTWATSENPRLNTHIRIFGRPVRALADGEVLAFEDQRHDNPLGSTRHDRPVEGNYLWVRYGDLDVQYSHLRRGSVIVSVGQRVSAGRKLAEVGNSGNTGGAPHLHMQCQRASDGTLRPFVFKRAWQLDQTLVPPAGGPGDRVSIDGRGICFERAAIRPFADDHGPLGPNLSHEELETLVAEILAGVSQGGGGFVIVGGRIVKVPPRGIRASLLNALVDLDDADGLATAAAAQRRKQIAGALDKALQGFKDGR